MQARVDKSSDENNEQPKRWYQEFWAWFVLAPLLLVVVMSSFTVSLAVINADDRVIDNYYKEGRMINMRIDEDLKAAQLQLQANIVFDQSINELAITLSSATSAYPEQITLEFSHPSDKELDHDLVLTHIAKGQYQAELPVELAYRWYLRLSPNIAEKDSQPWRLRGEIDFSRESSVLLSAEL